MTDQPVNSGIEYVAPKEPPQSRKPPANTVGVVGWLRENLFDGVGNSIATILTAIFLIWFAGSVMDWSIRTAEWTVVNNNLRLLMVGPYDQDELWRVTIMAVAMIVLSGMSLGFWSEIARPVFVTIVVVMVLLVIVPVVSDRFPPPSIRTIVSSDGDVPAMRFVGNPGERVTVAVEQINAENADPDGNAFNGFIETTPGASNSRSIWNDIKQGIRTDSIDLDTYTLTFTVSLVDASGEVLETVTSTPDEPGVTFETPLPETGWYGVLAEVDESSDAGFAWIRLDGVETYTTRTADVEARTERYGEQPALTCADGSDACNTEVAQRALRYEGQRSGFDYLTVQLSPFFRDIAIPLIVGTVIAFAGGVLGWFLKRLPREPKRITNLTLLVAWLLFMPFAFVLLRGFEGSEAVSYVPTTDWGGLALTLILTAIPIVASFPIGILLALGRANKDLVMVSTISTLFIEVARGVPLITILFFAKLILPFFISASSNIELAPRMMVGLTLFTAAYVAEIIRGGLQIIPKGQTEAAQALGLPAFYITWLITMPQAIRAVIPALMSQFVSLFKDTTLVSIVGLFELLGIVELIVNGQQQYRPFQREAYLFVGVVYFVISLAMASISRRLENTGVGAARR
ncbi:MAG: amino acid ABC transporter permease [Chloroflexota bacterium]